jgi:hypothetical protein
VKPHVVFGEASGWHIFALFFIENPSLKAVQQEGYWSLDNWSLDN